MVLWVAAAGIASIIYLIPILFVLPDVGLLLSVANRQPIGLVFKIATRSSGGGFGLLFLILGILCFIGVGALTAASRCTYAFARGGAIPGSRLWSRVDKRLGVPLWGLMLSTIVDCVFGCIVSYLTRFLPSSLRLVDVRNGDADCWVLFYPVLWFNKRLRYFYWRGNYMPVGILWYPNLCFSCP
jgi:amino acid transporter